MYSDTEPNETIDLYTERIERDVFPAQLYPIGYHPTEEVDPDEQSFDAATGGDGLYHATQISHAPASAAYRGVSGRTLNGRYRGRSLAPATACAANDTANSSDRYLYANRGLRRGAGWGNTVNGPAAGRQGGRRERGGQGVSSGKPGRKDTGEGKPKNGGANKGVAYGGKRDGGDTESGKPGRKDTGDSGKPSTENPPSGKVAGKGAAPSLHRPSLQMWMAFLLALAGLTLLYLGFWLPPEGEIHSSVLVAFGETSTFAGALLGVDYQYRYGCRRSD